MTRCDGETGQAGNRDNPPNVGGVTAWYAEWDPVRGPHQGQQSKVDCINRPNRRLLPTNANTSNFSCNAGAIHRRRSAGMAVAARRSAKGGKRTGGFGYAVLNG